MSGLIDPSNKINDQKANKNRHSMRHVFSKCLIAASSGSRSSEWMVSAKTALVFEFCKTGGFPFWEATLSFQMAVQWA